MTRYMPAKYWVLCLIASLLCLGAAGTRAADDADLTERPLEELTRMGVSTFSTNSEVSTAAKYAQTGNRAPTATRVVTSQDIRTLYLDFCSSQEAESPTDHREGGREVASAFRLRACSVD